MLLCQLVARFTISLTSLVELLQNEASKSGNDSKSSKMDNVMSVATKTVNFVCSKGCITDNFEIY